MFLKRHFTVFKRLAGFEKYLLLKARALDIAEKDIPETLENCLDVFESSQTVILAGRVLLGKAKSFGY